MTELELLRRIAHLAIQATKLKREYFEEMRKYSLRFPLVDQRYSKEAVVARKRITDPIHNKLKETKRQLEGWLFIYEKKEWLE